jgi:hypothetical protein
MAVVGHQQEMGSFYGYDAMDLEQRFKQFHEEIFERQVDLV